MSADDKQSALGVILELDEDATSLPGTAYTPIVCASSINWPAQEREEAEDRCLGDQQDVPVPAGEAQSELTFTHTWKPGGSDDTRLKTLYDSQDVAAWRITHPHPGTPVQWEEFLGRVRVLTPQTLEPTGVYRRDVAVRRVGPLVPGTTP